MSTKLHFFLFSVHFLVLGRAEAFAMTKPGCQEKCGNVSIPYPFGIGSNCSFDESTDMRCDSTFSPPRLFFTHSIPYQVVDLSIPTTDTYLSSYYESIPSVRIKHNVSRICYDGSGAITSSHDSFLSVYNNTPFTLSLANRFTVIGCNMRGVIKGILSTEDSEGLMVGCTNHCDEIQNSVERKCPGPGCWQVKFPDYVTGPYSIQVEALNVLGIRDDSRCGSAFLTDESEYNFNASDIMSMQDTTVMLDINFGFGNQTCEDAKKNPSSFACKGVNTECTNGSSLVLTDDGVVDVLHINEGYNCSCEDGYVGNPYLDTGCPDFKDGNECDEHQKKSCKHKCIKTRQKFFYEGGIFVCHCGTNRKSPRINSDFLYAKCHRDCECRGHKKACHLEPFRNMPPSPCLNENARENT